MRCKTLLFYSRLVRRFSLETLVPLPCDYSHRHLARACGRAQWRANMPGTGARSAAGDWALGGLYPPACRARSEEMSRTGTQRPVIARRPPHVNRSGRCTVLPVVTSAESGDRVVPWPGPNGIKLSGHRHQPENDPGQRGQACGLARFSGLVPAAWPLGLALVAAAGPPGHEVAGECDLESQVGGEVVKAVRGKSIRSR